MLGLKGHWGSYWGVPVPPASGWTWQHSRSQSHKLIRRKGCLPAWRWKSEGSRELRVGLLLERGPWRRSGRGQQQDFWAGAGHFGLSHAGPVFLPQVRHLEKEVQLKKNVILDETIQIKLLVCRKKFHKGNISYLRALPMNLILRKHTSNYFTSSLNPLSLLLSFVLKVKPYDTGF